MQTVQVKILNPKIGQDPNFPLPTRATDFRRALTFELVSTKPLPLKQAKPYSSVRGLRILLTRIMQD